MSEQYNPINGRENEPDIRGLILIAIIFYSFFFSIFVVNFSFSSLRIDLFNYKFGTLSQSKISIIVGQLWFVYISVKKSDLVEGVYPPLNSQVDDVN